jgi:hypothetical protein
VLLPVALALIFIAVTLLFFPFRDKFQFDGDEGIELVKAMLVERGYPLYTQVWSDQPPLLTHFIVAVFRLFGLQVNITRFAVLQLSAVLVWACCQFLRSVSGRASAVAGALLIILLPFYLPLSVAVMAGLPSLAFAMLSLLALVAWHRQRGWIWLVLSALALSISILIKLITAFLIPIFLAGILLAELSRLRWNVRLRALLRPGLLWSVTLAAAMLALAFGLVGPGNFSQLYQSHLGASVAIRREIFTINYHLRDSLPLLALAALGVLYTLLRKRWLALYLVAWMGIAYLLLSFLSPVWYHHQLLVTIPAAMLAAISVGEAFRSVPEIIRKRDIGVHYGVLAALSMAGLALVFYDQVPDILPGLESGANRVDAPLRASPIKEDVYQFVELYAPETRWMVTDMPIFAFRFRLLVPPNLSAISAKRLKSDLLGEEELRKTIHAYQPEQVLLRAKLPNLDSYLRQRYQLVYTRRDVDLYIRNDLYARHQ